MSFWFHGTNKENADLILESGFKKGTYFAKHLESSLVMGGKYIFWVWFEEDPTEYWEYISNQAVSKNQILLLRKYSTQKIHYNKTLARNIRFFDSAEYHGTNEILLCTECDGKGELNDREWDECANGKYGKACHICGGFGCLRVDGSRMNEISELTTEEVTK